MGELAGFLADEATEFALDTFLGLALLDFVDLAIFLVVDFGADFEGFLWLNFTI